MTVANEGLEESPTKRVIILVVHLMGGRHTDHILYSEDSEGKNSNTTFYLTRRISSINSFFLQASFWVRLLPPRCTSDTKHDS